MYLYLLDIGTILSNKKFVMLNFGTDFSWETGQLLFIGQFHKLQFCLLHIIFRASNANLHTYADIFSRHSVEIWTLAKECSQYSFFFSFYLVAFAFCCREFDSDTSAVFHDRMYEFTSSANKWVVKLWWYSDLIGNNVGLMW